MGWSRASESQELVQQCTEECQERHCQRADDGAACHRQNEEHNHKSDVANPIVDTQRVVGKKMANDVATIERRQRNQVEDSEHDVDEDCELEQLCQRSGHIGAAEIGTNPAWGGGENGWQSDGREKSRK